MHFGIVIYRSVVDATKGVCDGTLPAMLGSSHIETAAAQQAVHLGDSKASSSNVSEYPP
jgi:hypothetical protein